jgi:hypothetical protein
MIVAHEKYAFDDAASFRQSSGIITQLARRPILATVKAAEYRHLNAGDAACQLKASLEA